MDITDSTQKLKRNFLEFWKNISNEDTQTLITLDNTNIVRNKISKYSDENCGIDKVLLVFHSYASVAYLSAERLVNAKIYFDVTKTRYIILARKKDISTFCFSVVYSNITELSKYPTKAIPADNVLDYLERDNAVQMFKEFLFNKNNI
jgi:hypothetical protein